jgi:hypothetical protein
MGSGVSDPFRSINSKVLSIWARLEPAAWASRLLDEHRHATWKALPSSGSQSQGQHSVVAVRNHDGVRCAARAQHDDRRVNEEDSGALVLSIPDAGQPI